MIRPPAPTPTPTPVNPNLPTDNTSGKSSNSMGKDALVGIATLAIMAFAANMLHAGVQAHSNYKSSGEGGSKLEALKEFGAKTLLVGRLWQIGGNQGYDEL